VHDATEKKAMNKPSLVIALIALVASFPLAAQQSTTPAPIKRTVLQKVDVPGSPNYETVTGIAEISPSVNIGRHTHPGAETGYLIEGAMTLLVEGKPPLALKAGDSYQIPVNAIHDAKTGDNGAKVLAVYIVEKGKPLASPAP
jgi:quercetin dioxygenase-like cupin family protein